MEKIVSVILAVLTGLLAGGQPNNPAELFTIQLLCTSPEIYRIDYVAYLDSEYLCTGGVANFEEKPLNMDPAVLVYFSQDDLEGKEEGSMSLELRLYDEKEDKEIAVLGPVEVEARLGKKDIIQISGDKTSGFAAKQAAQQHKSY